jgi:4-amino-4-deoxy-L-arabinose transferase-like glycosyltransferase
VVLAVGAAVWSLVILVTGGVALPLLSSRNPRNPAIAAVVALACAFALGQAGRRRALVVGDLHWIGVRLRAGGAAIWNGWTLATERLERLPRFVAPLLVIGIAAGLIATSIRHTAFVAAGSDAFGYVSQAHMWATGTLRQPQPLMAELAAFVPPEAMAPLAYRPAQHEAAIVPVTSPGLPMLMAVAEIVVGPQAVFAVVPLLAALAVWATYLLGCGLSGRWTGVAAAALLASSPAFLFQLTSSPMSDIPASAFWALSLAAALRAGGTMPNDADRSSRRRAGSTSTWFALGSGAAAGMAILIRANLAPVAIVPAAMVVWNSPRRWRSGLMFSLAVIPAAGFIAWLYTYWYGSPLNSGYGSLDALYSAANIAPNLSRYSRWLLESQTPLVLAAVIAPILVRRRMAAAALLAFTAAVLCSYLLYFPFDVWWYLRFLLPAYPALLVLTAGALLAVSRRLPTQLRSLVTVALLMVVANRTIAYAAARATFDTGGEQKYAITGRYVADHLPANAVIFCEQHSGSLRYYANRTTIRYGGVPVDHLEGAVAELDRLGYRPYLVVEDWEEEVFRQRFAGRGVLDALAGGAEVELPLGKVRIYPLAR